MKLKPCQAGCGTLVRFVTHVGTGKPAPIEWQPSVHGTVRYDEYEETYEILGGEALAEARKADEDLFRNHLTVCPHRNRPL